jgi:hypothetical protein
VGAHYLPFYTTWCPFNNQFSSQKRSSSITIKSRARWVNNGGTLDYRTSRVSANYSLSRKGSSNSSIVVYLEIGRGMTLLDFRSFNIFGFPRRIVFQSSLVNCSRYDKSIRENAIMMSFIPGKPKVVTCNSSKYLEPMSLC